MYHQESQRIFNALRQEMPHLTGGAVFQLGCVSFNVEGRDGTGGLIQEWLGVWASKRFSIYDPQKIGNGTQTFPDFYVGEDDSMLEVKAFDMDASPNFDVANFESYCESVEQLPERMNSDYLIFGYTLNQGALSVQDVWLKKVWEITGSSNDWPLKVQVKREVIYNIRPINWFSPRARFAPFPNREAFYNALMETQRLYRAGR